MPTLEAISHLVTEIQQEPIGSRGFQNFPTDGSDYRKSSDPTSDNFLSESDTKESNNFRQDPVGSYRIIWDIL
jgi:hypothetical protein